MNLLRQTILLFTLFLFALATKEQICNEHECYPHIFLPTTEFQEVKEGQQIPSGILSMCYVSYNRSTY
jgi:hypothetical protein